MKVLVTGATGFVGRHLVAALLNRGHELVLTARRPDGPGDPGVTFVPYDLLSSTSSFPEPMLRVDVVMHLAWPGLPNYGELFHIEQNLPASYRLLKRLAEGGIRRILVTGTCFEYGMCDGVLSEDRVPQPANPYAIAKDMLRRQLELLAARAGFVLQWVRLFYMYGPGQNPKSLLAQLDAAITRGDTAFDMSMGEQLRDYLPVEEVAYKLALLAENDVAGIFNCCSGEPISVRRLVEDHIARRGAAISLNLGRYPYSPLEPLAFWGSTAKMDALFRTGSGSGT